MNNGARGLLTFPAVRVVTVFALLLALILSCGVVLNKIRRNRQWETFQKEVREMEIPALLQAEILVLFEREDPEGKQLRLAAEGIENVMPNGISAVLFVELENKLTKSAYGKPQQLPPNFKVGELGSWCDLSNTGKLVQRRFEFSMQAFIPLPGYPGKAAIYAVRYVRG